MNVEIEELLALARAAAKGKRRSAEVAAFMVDPMPRLLALQRELAEEACFPRSHQGAVRARAS